MTVTCPAEPITRSLRAMNTDCRFVSFPTASSSAAIVERALDDAEARLRAFEERFSRFRDSSELSLINRRSDDWVTVSPEMAEVLRLAADLHAETSGVFDPSILDQLEFAGYRGSFETIPAEGPPLRGVAPRRRDFADIEFRDADRLRLPSGLRLDLGGIVKGWAADHLANHLSSLGPALIDLGGDIAARGVPPDEPGWLVGVESGEGDGKLLTMLQIDTGGIATSGTNRRRWKRGDQWQHHLIDPRTGAPAQTDLCQVVALDASAARAEAWAKTALIIGSAACEHLLATRPDLALLLVADNGTATASPGVLRRLANPAGEARPEANRC